MTHNDLGACPFNERLYYLSNEWFQAAQERIDSISRRVNTSLLPDDFLLTESYKNAPKGIGGDHGVASWTLSLEKGVFRVHSGTSETAAFRVEGDYQRALPIAQAVGDTARKRARRECWHLHGEAAYSTSGEMPGGLLEEILRDLRDHLARRTMDTEDLDYRLDRLGLTDHLQQVEDQGYTILENAISDEFADELREACLEEAYSHRNMFLKTGRIDIAGLIRRGRPFEQIVQVPRLMTLMEGVLGGGLVLHSAATSVTQPGPGGVPLHTDYGGLGMVAEPYPEIALLGVAVWALEDWLTEEVGPTFIQPGSHTKRRTPGPKDKAEGGVPMLMPKGSAVFFSYGVWHWQGVRTAPGERVALHNTYTRPFIRQGDDCSKLDEVLHRHSPVLSGVVGEDLHFGRTDHSGIDESRLLRLHEHVRREHRRRKGVYPISNLPPASNG